MGKGAGTGAGPEIGASGGIFGSGVGGSGIGKDVHNSPKSSKQCEYGDLCKGNGKTSRTWSMIIYGISKINTNIQRNGPRSSCSQFTLFLGWW